MKVSLRRKEANTFEAFQLPNPLRTFLLGSEENKTDYFRFRFGPISKSFLLICSIF